MEDIISAENLTFYYSEPTDDDEPQAQVNKILVFIIFAVEIDLSLN